MQSCKWRNLVWEKHKSVKVSLLYGLFFSLLTSPSLSQVILKPWARQCRRHHHPHRRHHHPYHRHKDLHQLESTSSGFPDWSNALRTPLPSCWRQPRCCVSLSFSSFLSSFRSSYCNSIIFRWLNLASKVDAAVSLLWTKVLPLNSSCFNSFRRRSHVIIQSSSGGCSTCPPPSSPTMISAQLHLPGDCVVIYDDGNANDCLNVALMEWYRFWRHFSFTLIVHFPPRVVNHHSLRFVAPGFALSFCRSSGLRQAGAY